MIQIRNITKQYTGSLKKANNNISMQIKKGEILCIAGENGAGKTTLMKILMGLEKPSSGEIIKDEKTTIGMVHQHFMLFPEYTAAQNIVIKNPPVKFKIFLDNKKANTEAQKIIDKNNFSINSTQKVKDLALGQMQQVEICRALYQNADLIILDEPTAILTDMETQSLFKTVKNLAKEGKSIIFITHKLPEIYNFSDRVAILKKGELICILENNKLNENEITRIMTGSDFSPVSAVPLAEKKSTEIVKKIPIIKFDNVTVKRHNQTLPLLDNISFTVHSGEILGFTGTGGNGLGVIEAVLGGFLHPTQGKILHRDKDISRFSIRRLRKNGLAFVPADRKKYGSAGKSTIEENIIINCRDNFYKNGWLNKKEAKEFSQKLMQEYNIQGEPGKTASTLSGGNLQKLLLAREINSLKDYIVFSEPAWGLDIASTKFIMSEILKLKDKGAAVILISTDAEEVYALADRVIVMEKGRIAEK
ncbi:MAG: ATP-binding cassette domain-containing protein [Treponema sp.]|jgi:simple sugar transport system ATP-binding protein|nr:ATP-binding cassette domain-containing protein [Treponema sp.]